MVDFDDEAPIPDTEVVRCDDESTISRELSMIRAAFIQQGQMVSTLHSMITQVQAQHAAFEQCLLKKIDDVLTALQACDGCSRAERLEAQIEKLRSQ